MYQIVLKTEDFIIVDKSANVLTVPSRMGTEDVRPCLGKQLEIDFKIKILPVHRLDFEVSGLVIFATTSEAQRESNLWFERKEIFKTYEALSSTKSEMTSFPLNVKNHWECLLMKGKKRAYEAPFGKKSITEATLIDIDKNNIHRWHLNPITGRSHQLRFELSRHEHPILGDTLYGSNITYKIGIALRAFKIDFRKCSNYKKFNLPDEIKILGL